MEAEQSAFLHMYHQDLSSCILAYMPETCTVDMSMNLETRDKMPS